MRDYLGDKLHIDGRYICYRLVTAIDYLKALGWSEDEIEKFVDENDEIYTLINQVMALKQSCFLLRRTSYSCGSLSDDLHSLKMRLIRELRDAYGFEFDDELVERDGKPQQICKVCDRPMIEVYDGKVQHGTYYHTTQADHAADFDHTPVSK